MSDEATSGYYDGFRTRLVSLRESLGYSQEQFADLLEIPRSNYKKYETRSKFPLHCIERLALVTRADIDFLVTGRNVRPFRTKVAS